ATALTAACGLTGNVWRLRYPWVARSRADLAPSASVLAGTIGLQKCAPTHLRRVAGGGVTIDGGWANESSVACRHPWLWAVWGGARRFAGRTPLPLARLGCGPARTRAARCDRRSRFAGWGRYRGHRRAGRHVCHGTAGAASALHSPAPGA